MNEVLTLIKRTNVTDDSGKLILDSSGRPVVSESTREVFCSVLSIGMKEFYQANATDFHPEVKFVLPDYLDYDNETLVEYSGDLAPAGMYRILRTYRKGLELELTAERAPAEEVGVNG